MTPRGHNLGLSADVWQGPGEERGLAWAQGILQCEHPPLASPEHGAAQCLCGAVAE